MILNVSQSVRLQGSLCTVAVFAVQDRKSILNTTTS